MQNTKNKNVLNQKNKLMNIKILFKNFKTTILQLRYLESRKFGEI